MLPRAKRDITEGGDHEPGRDQRAAPGKRARTDRLTRSNDDVADRAPTATGLAPGSSHELPEDIFRDILDGPRPDRPARPLDVEGHERAIGRDYDLYKEIHKALDDYQREYRDDDVELNVGLLDRIERAAAPHEADASVLSLLVDLAAHKHYERGRSTPPSAAPSQPPPAPPAPAPLAPKAPPPTAPAPVPTPAASSQDAASSSRTTARRSNVVPAYGTDFERTSIGLESELKGVACALPKGAQARSFAFVRGTDARGEALVQLTKDMSPHDYDFANRQELQQSHAPRDQSPNRWSSHTLELVTYPAEVADERAVELRKAALKFVVAALHGHLAAHNHEPLSPTVSEDGRFELVVSSTHVVYDSHATDGLPSVTVPASGIQATVGIEAALLADPGSTELGYLAGAPWYQRSFADEWDDPAVDQSAKYIYAYLRSIIAFVAELVEKQNCALDGDDAAAPDRESSANAETAPPRRMNNLFAPPIKNLWKILPRTRPYLMLDVLQDEARRAVRNKLRETCTGTPAMDSARKYVMNGNEVAGHGIDNAKVRGNPAALFEFREASVIPAALAQIVPDGSSADEVTDPLAGISPFGRSAIIAALNKAIQASAEDFKTWWLAKYPTKAREKALQLATARDKVEWAERAGIWHELKSVAAPAAHLAPPPMPAPSSSGA